MRVFENLSNTGSPPEGGTTNGGLAAFLQTILTTLVRQFQSDDADAGRSIGKILGMLFVYTVIAMSIVVRWTFRTIVL